MWCAQTVPRSPPLPRASASMVGMLRRFGSVQDASALRSLTVITQGRRALSTEKPVDGETQWVRAMGSKYGPGNYQLFRALYKDLCDEIRREYYTKPPPPPLATRTTNASSSLAAAEAAPGTRDSSSGAAKQSSGAGGAGVTASPTHAEGMSEASEREGGIGEVTPAAQQTAASRLLWQPEETYGDGSWSVQHRPEDNVVVFHRDAVKEGRLAAVHAWARIELKDPPRLNAVLTFADWIPLEVCVERNGVILHFSMASNEGGMHMRNVRVYAPKSALERAAFLDPSDDGEHARKNFYYDGPCLWHLEQDMLNELYDVMQDHGVTLDWIRWAASWVFYLEYVNYVRWNLGMLEELIPSSVRGPEEDFLLPVEKALLEEPVEDWLSAHSI
ncbi:Mitochondrial glycoprotein [Leishmania braziliensis]|nr:Mitochondrial glycoprotein [Leishmania braziliensis]